MCRRLCTSDLKFCAMGDFKSYAADHNVRGTLIAGGLQRPAGGDSLCVQNTQTAGEDRHMSQNGRWAK